MTVRPIKMPLLLATALPLLFATGCKSILGHHVYTVPTDSMSPFIRKGDDVVSDELKYARTHFKDGDVIVVRHGDNVLVKRVLAMPGETIRGQDRKIYRNKALVTEPYLAPVDTNDRAIAPTFPERTLPAGELFVLGDNRDHSLDSRTEEFGVVHPEDVVGVVAMLLVFAKL